MLKKLCRVAFASMFVLDVCDPRIAFGEGKDWHHDTSMYLDDERDEVYEIRGEADPISDMQETLVETSTRNLGNLGSQHRTPGCLGGQVSRRSSPNAAPSRRDLVH